MDIDAEIQEIHRSIRNEAHRNFYCGEYDNPYNENIEWETGSSGGIAISAKKLIEKGKADIYKEEMHAIRMLKDLGYRGQFVPLGV